jgi:hypothetical protein
VSPYFRPLDHIFQQLVIIGLFSFYWHSALFFVHWTYLDASYYRATRWLKKVSNINGYNGWIETVRKSWRYAKPLFVRLWKLYRESSEPYLKLIIVDGAVLKEACVCQRLPGNSIGERANYSKSFKNAVTCSWRGLQRFAVRPSWILKGWLMGVKGWIYKLPESGHGADSLRRPAKPKGEYKNKRRQNNARAD